MTGFRTVSAVLLLSSAIAAAQSSAPPPASTDPVHPGTACDCVEYYDVVSGDGCYAITQKFPPLTLDEFYSYNPYIDSSNCGNLQPGYAVCVKISDAQPVFCSSTTSSAAASQTSTQTQGSTTPSVTTTIGPYSAIGATAASSYVQANITQPTGYPPSPTQSGLVSTCNQFYYVSMRDTCQGIAARYMSWIDYDDFISMNPALGANCTGLLAGYFVCVGMPIDVGTPGYANSSGNGTTGTNTTYTPWTAPAPQTYTPIATPSPVQSGILSNCTDYYLAQTNDNCTYIEWIYNLQHSAFLSWNPALGNDCSGLTPGDYYCVSNSTTGSPAPTVTASPSPVLSGIASDCNTWYQARPAIMCEDMSDIFGTFNESEFVDWNPAVGSNCATPTLVVSEYYCVGVPGIPTTRTATPPPQPTSTGGAVNPVQPGILASCTQYWFVGSADNCTSIEQRTGVSASNFLAWNPAVHSDCSGLMPNYYVCVGNGTDSGGTVSGGQSVNSTTGPTATPPPTSTTTNVGTPTTTGGGGGSTPAPIQSGMVSGCTRFYFVEKDDGCYNIAQAAGITLDNFYAWNPAVHNDCSGLDYGYYVCIGISPAPGTTITTGSPVPAPTS